LSAGHPSDLDGTTLANAMRMPCPPTTATMTTPVDITFRNLEPAPVVAGEIRDRVTWLEHYHPGIQGCRVVLEVPHRHQRHGREICVAVDVTLPGDLVAIRYYHAAGAGLQSARRRSSPGGGEHLDQLEAIRETFRVVRRRMEAAARRRRGD
jgi:hypothetical protein